MKSRCLNEKQFLLGLALLPLLLMGIILVFSLVMGAVQYNPAYFDEEYVQRYQTPGLLLKELEQSLRQGDAMKIAELQGTYRVPRTIKPLSNLQFSMFWDEGAKYQDYLYMDASNYQRYMLHIKMVEGRYVWAPENLYYYVDSGRWIRTFYPILAIWWIVLFLYMITRRVHRALTNFKPETVNNHVRK